MQIGLYLRFIFLFCGFLLFLGGVILLRIILVVHLHFSVPSIDFLTQLLAVLVDSTINIKARDAGLLSGDSYSAPTCEKHEFGCRVFILEDL